MQAVAVLLIAIGIGAAAGSLGGTRLGVTVFGVLVAVGAAVFVLEMPE